MTRTKLKDRILPVYTKGEEIFNMTSHIVGASFGVVALVLCVIFSAIHGNAYAVVSSAIYGTSMILLYTMSSIYHGINPKRIAKKVFQILDHCSIFLLIAGSYTPFCLVLFREYNNALGWLMFGVIWGVSILGIVLNSIDIKKYKVLSMICYLALGWCVVFKIDVLVKFLNPIGLALLVLGGVTYSIGAILYAIGKRKKYMHSVFHLFVLAGSILQFLCILLFVV